MNYVVVQPDSPNYGIVISRHRTRAAAERAICDQIRACRLANGTNTWLERTVVETSEVGERVCLRPS